MKAARCQRFGLLINPGDYGRAADCRGRLQETLPSTLFKIPARCSHSLKGV